MTKAVIFDLDGVLISAKEIHYEALNLALNSIDPKYVINREEHLSIYDGLPTKEKLILLTDNKGLPIEKYDYIWKKKQEVTCDVIRNVLTPDERLRDVLKRLKEDGYLIYVASNSIRETLKLMLYKTGLIEYVDYFMSNDDVKYPKPHPEIYLRCMVHAGVKPNETIIVEDSIHGREAAVSSGGILCPVDYPSDVTYEKIKTLINKMGQTTQNTKWESDEINVLIPCAGLGSRFKNAGYTFPKPLIEVNNKPMIQVVVENLNIKANFIYIVQKEHYEKYNLKSLLNLLTPNCTIVQVDGITEGAACTTLLAKEYINNDKPLIIANSDQFLEWDAKKFYYSIMSDKNDGTIVTFNAIHSKWSFAKIGEDGYVTEVAEKNPISNVATCGVYSYGKGSDYVKYAEQMIEKNIRTNGEFYIAPVYNEFIADGKKINTYHIDKFFGIGTPEDLHYFLENHK